MTEDSFLREVCFEAEKKYWQPILDEIASESNINIPAEADRHTIKYIRKLEKKYLRSNSNVSNSFNSKRGLKDLIIAAILIVLLSVSAFSFSPLKVFFYNIYNNCTEFVFSTFKSDKEDFLYAVYSYVPDGYLVTNNLKTKLGQEITYRNGSKRINIVTNISKYSSVFIDTENANTGTTKINGYEGYYSITERSIILVWSSGRYNHCITADLDNDLITLDTVIKIAESRVPY